MTLKLTIRKFISVLLSSIPIHILDRVKNRQYRNSIPSLLSEFLITRLIRYRRIDTDIDVFSLIDDSNLKFVNDGSFISRQLYWKGMRGYEYGEAKLWQHLCACREINRIVEMGANIGYFTVIGASAKKTVYTAIEANPKTAEFLTANIQHNALDHVRVLVSAVVGVKHDEMIELHIPKEEDDESAPTGAYISGGESIDRPSEYSVKVNTITAEETIENVDLIKLDIEGHEFIILNSIMEKIIELRPVIWVEVRRNTHQLRNLISGLSSGSNYDIFAICQNKLLPISGDGIKNVILQKVYNTRDVLIIPSEKIPLIRSYTV